jgi:hypothetical protein
LRESNMSNKQTNNNKYTTGHKHMFKLMPIYFKTLLFSMIFDIKDCDQS